MEHSSLNLLDHTSSQPNKYSLNYKDRGCDEIEKEITFRIN